MFRIHLAHVVSKTDKGPAFTELTVLCVAGGNIDFKPEPQINLKSFSGMCIKERYMVLRGPPSFRSDQGGLIQSAR